MEDGHVDIEYKIYLARRCLRFSCLDIRSSFVNLLSSSSVLTCFPSFMYVL